MSCLSKGLLRSSALLSILLALAASPIGMPGRAFALSELKPAQNTESEPKAENGGEPQQAQPAEPDEIEGDSEGIPLPDPLVDRSANQANQQSSTSDNTPEMSVVIEHDISKAPEPVRKLRQQIIDAAASGDIEKLRPFIAAGQNEFRIDGNDGEDPIAALKTYSGDPDGLEVLAIIIDLLSTGYAHVDAGTPDEAYVFPYFSGKPLNTLTAPEKVELLRIITAGDLADMQEFGNYSFYRVGISPDGKWKFFTAGD
ncbi:MULTISPECIES: hypothetical protein [Agrobacterium]|jgi:hypothetical protein|uniref:Uncharacterized protein n=1 Tax=Agrobacterium salinitolerans TaxID=1183413 RepID=A0A4Z1QUP9_9HYPH|nr:MULTISPECIES: hypothetical protein [Agrobacterium]MCZ7853302.1 hypothetical protein [Agrobacterium salinitolerans]MCZ7855752.1 hypothetical protein [Agrobacterium salinitolerans]MCZ7860412.1 hypothetical protein [Agrobacterium salinitolerans]MCZ7892069.1 hypothetical protein [Agrobacterium salinitolerans]MCZ7935947.1 hypothetical protein [Agrobacterium salinitolerans]